LATALITHPDCVLHEMGDGHPESPQRLRSIMAALQASGLAQRLVAREARPAAREELERVHGPDYIDAIFAAAPDQGYAFLDPDTSMNPKSLSAALHAAGAVRIACVGDSWTFGMNVDQDRSYPSRLAVHLREMRPALNVDVVNFGAVQPSM
jgi:acetoin utilization deacetylase AcuC-like enzyme